MFRKLRLTLFALTALLTLSAEAGKVFKWIDEQGITHYSSRPPVIHINAEVIKVPGEPDKAVGESKLASEKNSKDHSDNPPSPEVVEYCKKLFENLKALETNDSVRLEHEDGTFEILSDEGKEREKERVREKMAKYCQQS